LTAKIKTSPIVFCVALGLRARRS